MKQCACGCGIEIPDYRNDGKPRLYKNGHGGHKYEKGHPFGKRFKKGERANPEGEFKRNHTLNKLNKHYAWNGGKYITVGGYIKVKCPDHPCCDRDGYVLEHRLVWEQHNKAILLPYADVHHIDKNKINNDINNLQAMIHNQHMKLHHNYLVH